MIWTVSFAASSFTSAHSTLAPSRANRTAAAFPFPQPGPTDQWGLSRQGVAPRNQHHCSTNCRDTMDARNTPWMGNKGRDIPEPDILRAVGMVKHCNSQHSAVLALGRMGGRMPRDQPAEPRPGLLRSLSLQSFHCSPQALLRKSVSNRATLGYKVYCRRRVTLTRLLILCAETTLARNSCRIRVFSCKATRSLELLKMLVERRSRCVA